MPTSRATARRVTASSLPVRSSSAVATARMSARSLPPSPRLFRSLTALSIPITLQLLVHTVKLTCVSQRALAQLRRPGAMDLINSPAGQPGQHGHERRRAILAVMCLSLLVVVIDNTILNTVLPTVARVLHASTSGLQWITDGYTLTFAALLVMAGALGDRFGRRNALLLGLVIFAAGSAWAAVSGDSSTLIAARALMGVGAAFVMPATLSILTAVFPARERAGAISAWSAIAGIGIVVGPTLGGLLLAHFYWGSVFWVNVPLVAVAIVAVSTVVPSLPGERHAGTRLDIIGAALSAAAMLAIVDAVIEGP